MILSERAICILKNSGWDFNREVNTEPYIKFLNEKGYSINKSALDFLKSFGGIKVKFPSFREEISERLYFDPLISDVLGSECVRFYEEKLGEKLTLVGFSPASILAILVSESGKFYGGTGEEEILFFLGNDFSEAIEELINDRYGVQVDF